MRHIQNESGAKAHLRGKGSGYIEIGQREEQLEPLHIYLQADRQVEIDYARRLAEDLLNTVKVEVDNARMVPAMQMGYGGAFPNPALMGGAPNLGMPYQQPYPMGGPGSMPNATFPSASPYPMPYAYPPYQHSAVHTAPTTLPPPAPPTSGSYQNVPPPPGLYKQ